MPCLCPLLSEHGLREHAIVKQFVCDNEVAGGSIVRTIEKRGESVLNDHVAFRAYRSSEVGLEKLAKIFEKNGYVAKGDYHFKIKKLYAKHYEHSDKTLPKIFISELLLDQCSSELQNKVKSLITE